MIKVNLPDEVANWLYYAEEDFQSARIMLKEHIYNKVCYFAQQTVEKILKAYLLHNHRDIIKTHKLVDLLEGIIKFDENYVDFQSEVVLLDRYYMPTRYPDALVGSLPEGLPSENQSREAMEIAEKILEFTKHKLGIY